VPAPYHSTLPTNRTYRENAGALGWAEIPPSGMPLGEFWVLDALARDCASDGQYACLLVSVPLNLRGGVGSPPQAVAIK